MTSPNRSCQSVVVGDKATALKDHARRTWLMAVPVFAAPRRASALLTLDGCTSFAGHPICPNAETVFSRSRGHQLRADGRMTVVPASRPLICSGDAAQQRLAEATACELQAVR